MRPSGSVGVALSLCLFVKSLQAESLGDERLLLVPLLFLQVLQDKTLIPFASYFQECWHSEEPGKTETVLPFRAKGRFVYSVIKVISPCKAKVKRLTPH